MAFSFLGGKNNFQQIQVITLLLICLLGAVFLLKWPEDLNYLSRPTLLVNPHRGLRPFEPLVITASELFRSGEIYIQGMQGETLLEGPRMVYYPNRLYPFGTELVVRVRALLASGEKVSKTFSVKTADFSNQLWIEADPGNSPQIVRVYQGNQEIKSLIASFGKADSPTPTGIFYLKDRGREFWSEKYQEGGYYWIRIQGNYLFHSTPFGRDKQLKESEISKLGSPASHGCIRLSLQDARWLYENVPDGTYLIIKRPESTGEPESVLTIAMATDVVKLDPHDTSDNPSSIVNMHIYDTLFELDQNGLLQPALAVSATPREKGRKWLIKIGPNIKFQDGSPLTAKEVEASFRRLLDPHSNLARRGLFAQYIDSVEAISPQTVVFILNQPLTIFPYFLAHSSSAVIKEIHSDSNGLIGTGPYVLESWEPGYKLVLSKSRYHWRSEPYFSKLVFMTVPQTSARSMLLETGSADVVFPLSPLEAERLSKNDHIQVEAEPSYRIIYVGLNLKKPFFQDERVRTALNLAVDKNALVDEILEGFGEVSASPLAPSVKGHHPSVTYPYDPSKARNLLEKAEVVGHQISLWAPKDRYLQDSKVAEAIAGYLTEIGLDVDLRLWEWSTYMSMLNRNKPQWDLFLLGWVPATGESYMGLAPLFKSNSRSNLTFFSDPRVEKLLDLALRTTSERQQLEIYAEVQDAICTFAPWIFLYAQHQTVGMAKNITGIKILPTEVISFRRARRNRL